jgi:hypothetical protein
VNEDERPLLLVICADPDRLARIRSRLRQAGFLTAMGRNFEGALNLLTQVIVDGCVLCYLPEPAQLQQLETAIRGNREGSVQLCIADACPDPPPGWTASDEERLAETARALLKGEE